MEPYARFCEYCTQEQQAQGPSLILEVLQGLVADEPSYLGLWMHVVIGSPQLWMREHRLSNASLGLQMQKSYSVRKRFL